MLVISKFKGLFKTIPIVCQKENLKKEWRLKTSNGTAIYFSFKKKFYLVNVSKIDLFLKQVHDYFQTEFTLVNTACKIKYTFSTPLYYKYLTLQRVYENEKNLKLGAIIFGCERFANLYYEFENKFNDNYKISNNIEYEVKSNIEKCLVRLYPSCRIIINLKKTPFDLSNIYQLISIIYSKNSSINEDLL